MVILWGPILKAQEGYLEAQVGNGWYAMGELREFNDYLVSQNPLNVVVNANSPPYPYYQLAYSWNWKDASLGLALSHHSTGSRLSLMDISGQYVFDSRVKSESISAFTRLFLIRDQAFKLALHFGFGGSTTRLSLEEFLEVDEEVLVEDQISFHALGFFMEGGLAIGYGRSFWELHLVGKFVPQLWSQDLYTTIEKQKAYFTYKGKRVNADWSGMRVGLEFRVRLQDLFGKGKEKT